MKVVAMRVWWVNQGQTFEEAVRDGCLWAPIVDGRGRQLSHWTRMREVSVDDVIVHYSRGQIRGVSSARSVAVEAPRTMRRAGHDQWVDQGLQIAVDFSSLESIVPLGGIPLHARLASLGITGAPFDKRGEVKVGYLFVLEGALLETILRVLRIDSAILEGSAAGGTALSSPYGESGLADPIMLSEPLIPNGPDRAVVAWARPEQRTFRKYLFGSGGDSLCDLCGKLLPVRLLRVAHIMPRSLLEVEERSALGTVMSACVLGCDALFELGYVVVDETGVISRGPRPVPPASDAGAAVDAIVGRSCTAFNGSSWELFQRHRGRHLVSSTI
jgi:hypothetical protein